MEVKQSLQPAGRFGLPFERLKDSKPLDSASVIKGGDSTGVPGGSGSREGDAHFGQTVSTQTDSVKLTTLRLDRGVATRLDVLQAQQVLDTANAQIPDLERAIAQEENAISILVGDYPHDVVRGLPLVEQTLPPELPPGLPSSIIERRPDIREAEQIDRVECSGLADQLARVIGKTGMIVIVRLSSFLLACIGVQIIWNGLGALPATCIRRFPYVRREERRPCP
jgi:hypothetical protein